ncbi:MAG: hypothetical protein HY680_09865 [Chloroflexi bacterium]|nr:hypothetical protein [Chloroflexota bacterium]
MAEQQRILAALEEYNKRWPRNDYPGAGTSWLNNERYSVALVHEGKLYPPKYIWAMVIGVATPDFNTAEATNGLEDAGFQIITKPGATRR